MRPSSLDIPSKTAAGHAALSEQGHWLPPAALDLLGQVDGRHTVASLLESCDDPSAARHALLLLERHGFVVRADCVSLPGEAHRGTPSLRRIRRLLTRVLLIHTPLSGLRILRAVWKAPDLEALRTLMPAVRTCLSVAHSVDPDGLIDEAEGLLYRG